MVRNARVQYEGAVYHAMSRAHRSGDVFLEDKDREMFLGTLSEACLQTRRQVYAYCLMKNHFNLVLETPEPNYVTSE